MNISALGQAQNSAEYYTELCSLVLSAWIIYKRIYKYLEFDDVDKNMESAHEIDKFLKIYDFVFERCRSKFRTA